MQPLYISPVINPPFMFSFCCFEVFSMADLLCVKTESVSEWIPDVLVFSRPVGCRSKTPERLHTLLLKPLLWVVLKGAARKNDGKHKYWHFLLLRLCCWSLKGQQLNALWLECSTWTSTEKEGRDVLPRTWLNYHTIIVVLLMSGCSTETSVCVCATL